MRYKIKGETLSTEVSHLKNNTIYKVNDDGTITIFKGSYGWAPRGFDSNGNRIFYKMIVDEDFVIPNDTKVEMACLTGLCKIYQGKVSQWRNNSTDAVQPFYTGVLRSSYKKYAIQYDITTNLIVGDEFRLTNIGDLKNCCLPSFFIQYHASDLPEVYLIPKIVVDPDIYDVKSLYWLTHHEPEVVKKTDIVVARLQWSTKPPLKDTYYAGYNYSHWVGSIDTSFLNINTSNFTMQFDICHRGGSGHILSWYYNNDNNHIDVYQSYIAIMGVNVPVNIPANNRCIVKISRSGTTINVKTYNYQNKLITDNSATISASSVFIKNSILRFANRYSSGLQYPGRYNKNTGLDTSDGAIDAVSWDWRYFNIETDGYKCSLFLDNSFNILQ